MGKKRRRVLVISDGLNKLGTVADEDTSTEGKTREVMCLD